MANMAKINDWLQVVGMFGLIASLVFVGMQIKQDHEIALSGIYQARSDATVNSSLAAINSPAFLDAGAKIYANRPDDLTMQEAIAWEFYIGASVTALENNHQQFLLGYLSEEHWRRNLQDLKCTLELRLNREMLRDWSFRDPFQKLIDELSEQAVQNPIGCWNLESVWSYPVAD